MATGGTQPEPANLAVEKVEVHLPSFSTIDPELFFARAEISFSAAGVTSDATKFIHACQALDNKSAEVVRDIFMKPPTQDRYQFLKTELIRRLASSQEQRMRQLLETEEIGDRKPSQFLRHLRHLAGNNASDEMLRMLWMGRLPHETQVALATQIHTPLDDLAKLADIITDMIPQRPVISPIDNRTLDAMLEEKIARLTTLLEEKLAATSRQREPSRRRDERSRGRNPERARSSSRSRQKGKRNSDGLCFYHSRFGERARKCQTPCSWQENDPAGQ